MNTIRSRSNINMGRRMKRISRTARRWFSRKAKFIVIGIIVLLLTAGVVPPTLANPDSIERKMSYYGFFEEHQQVLDDKLARINSEEVLSETRDRLEAVDPYTVQPKTDLEGLNVEIGGVPIVDPETRNPPILDATKRSEIWNKSTIIDFLLDQPLSYMMITFYGNHTTMTKGLLRQSLFFPESDVGTDWGWKEIDVDNDPLTGVGAGGWEIQARMRFQIENITLPELSFPLPEKLTITVEGSLVLEVEKLVNTTLPLEIYFAKYASYEGKNFIISVGYHFDDTPIKYVGRTLIDKIVFEDIGGTVIDNIRKRLGTNITDGNIAEINGPYSVFYESDSPLKALDVIIAMIRVDEFILTDWTWVKMSFRNKPGLDSIPTNGELWLNNTILYAPIDTIIWRAGPFDDRQKIPFIYSIEFYETREKLVWALAVIEDMPPYFRMSMDYTQKVDGKNVTILDYETSSPAVERFEYIAIEYPFFRSTGNIVDFNVSHVLFRDLPLKLRFEVTSDVGRNLNDTISRDPAIGLVANVIDNVIIRVAKRFYRIGDSLKEMATSMATLPARKGWAELSVDSGAIGLISLYRSSNQYLYLDNDYVTFYNKTNDKYPGYLVDFPIAAKMRDIEYMRTSFKNDTEIELKRQGRRELDVVFVDDTDFAFAKFSNVPSEIAIRVTDDVNTFVSYCIDRQDPSTCDFTSPEAISNRIDKFDFISKSGKQYMDLTITDIPNLLTVKHDGSTILFDAGKNDYIGAIEFSITNNIDYPIQRLPGDHFAFLDVQPEYSAASGKLSGLQYLTYNPGEGGRTDLVLKNESAFAIRMINDLDDPIDATIILDPLPNHITMELPGTINSSIKRFPDVVNVSGEVDFSNIVFGIATLGNDIINIMNNISQNVVELVGDVSTDLTFEYTLEGLGSTLDLIASIERGIPELVPELNWSHGVIMGAKRFGNSVGLAANIYLQGLPRHANFSSTFGQDDFFANVLFEDYRPKYDWLYIERFGLQERNMNFFLDGLQPGIDLHLNLNLSTDISIGGRTDGMFDIKCVNSATKDPVNLGRLQVNMHRLDEHMSKTEVYISQIPSTFHMELSMFRDTKVDYYASESIDFIYVDISKYMTGEWYHSYVLFHDLPVLFEAEMNANTEYSIDKPMPLQGLPEFTIKCASKSLDMIVHTSGRGSGQRGNIELQIENVFDLKSKVKGDRLHLTSSGLDYIMLRMTDLPLLENFKIIKFELIAEDIRSMEMEIKTLFGVYPMFEIAELDGGAIEITLDHEMDLFGSKRHASIAIIDITYTSLGPVELPSETPVYNNGFSLEMKENKRHVFVPAPFTSLLISSF